MRRFSLLLLVALVAAPLYGQATEASILAQLKGVRAVPDTQRPAATLQIANEIRTLPAGRPKLKLAVGLSHLATEGDPGHETLQAVATTLGQALAENPLPAKGDEPPMPYMDLAKLVRYEHVTTDLKDPLLAKASDILVANDAEIEKVDFTLKDLHGKKFTLSELRGKIVLVNFWATWCPPCRKEMPDLDAIYTHFQSQGLVILSLSDEDMAKVGPFISTAGYHPPVLLDTDGKVAKLFHVDGIPKSFVFDREGKLVAQSIDMRTQHQFLMMLAQAGLHP
jgi:thiol-disulfide isomerase/thioredoxin